MKVVKIRTTVPTDDVGVADPRDDPRRNLAEHFVARQVAMRVVDPLEMIDVK